MKTDSLLKAHVDGRIMERELQFAFFLQKGNLKKYHLKGTDIIINHQIWRQKFAGNFSKVNKNHQQKSFSFPPLCWFFSVESSEASEDFVQSSLSTML